MSKQLSNLRNKELASLLKKLGLNIKNLDLLNLSLTHGSYLKDNPKLSLSDNERLEFFGDAVLKLYISEYLMEMFPDEQEGKLSKLRAYVVSDKILAKVALKLNLAKYILMGKSERKSMPLSILADSLEALLAVIYYECTSNVVRKFVVSNFSEHVTSISRSEHFENYKAMLQEYTQKYKYGLPAYKIISERGPEHNKEFEVAVYLDKRKLSTGLGMSKKEASQVAAKKALSVLKTIKGNKLE